MGQMIVKYSGAEEKGQLIHFLEGNGFCNIQNLNEAEPADANAQAICVDIQSWIFFGVSANASVGKRKLRRDVWTTRQFLDYCA